MNQLPNIRRRLKKRIRLHEAQIIAAVGPTFTKVKQAH